VGHYAITSFFLNSCKDEVIWIDFGHVLFFVRILFTYSSDLILIQSDFIQIIHQEVKKHPDFGHVT